MRDPGSHRDSARRILIRRRITLRRVAVLAVSALALAAIIVGLLSKPPDTRIDGRLSVKRAAPAPAFSLPLLAGGALPKNPSPRLAAALQSGRLSLAALRGTPVVLNIWASWCHPCREEAPILAAGWKSARRDGVLFLGLNMEDGEDTAKAFLTEFGIGYPIVRESGSAVARSFGATGIPETYFLDRGGMVVAHVIGALSSKTLAAGTKAARTGEVLGLIAGAQLSAAHSLPSRIGVSPT